MLSSEPWQRHGYTGPRPMVPSRDLGTVVELIKEGYAPWQSWKGKRALSALRILNRLGPLPTLLARYNAAFREFCSAVVWVEEGQVIGLVAGHPIGPDPRYWIFKNLEVQKSHRRHGIARGLMQSIIEKARAEGAEKAIGMVRTNNAASLNLTASLGFIELVVTSDLRLPATESVTPTLLSEVALCRIKATEWRKVYELAQATTPASLQRFKPAWEEDFRLGRRQRLSRWLRSLLFGRQEHQLAVEEGERFVAALTVQASRFWGEHRLELMVHSSWRGRLEEMIITNGLAILGRYPQRPINVHLFSAHTEAMQVLERYGFVEIKTQVIIGLELKPSVSGV
jgi:GNAT superfamily N-acetyltransferase